eukprot:gene26081-47283_t
MGGMTGVGYAPLVASVAKAGALGFIVAHLYPTAEELLEAIRWVQNETDKPFGVNLTILPSLTPIPYDEYRRAIIESGCKIVETAGRNPVAHMPDFKEAGVKVIHKCTSVRHAVTAAQLGVDVISIDGFECAGHPGEDDIGLVVLLPATVDKLDIPVIASGGMADGRSLAAALALGADGVKNLSAIAVDGAGQSSPATGLYPIVLDTTAPATPTTVTATDDQGAVTGPIAPGGSTDDASPAFSGSGAKAGDVVKLYDGAALIGSTAVNADGTWSLTPNKPLAQGAHSITHTLT